MNLHSVAAVDHPFFLPVVRATSTMHAGVPIDDGSCTPGTTGAGRGLIQCVRGERACFRIVVITRAHGGADFSRSRGEARAHKPYAHEFMLLAARLSSMQPEHGQKFIGGLLVSAIARALGCQRRTISRRKYEAMTGLGVTIDPSLFCVRANGIFKAGSHI